MSFSQGCQIFLGTIYQKGKKIYQMTIKYTEWPQNIPNSRKIDKMAINVLYQHLPLQDPPKFTQIGIFGLKKCHLATLLSRTFFHKCFLRLFSFLVAIVGKNVSRRH
jgi:hypothetical protein